MNRQQIIDTLKEALESNPVVHAAWLEGSISKNTADEYSDIDLVVDIESGKEKSVFDDIETSLRRLGNLDLSYTAPQPDEGLHYKIFHIEGTSEHLLIDVNTQNHGREFSFIENSTLEKPFVLFDKSGVIKFKTLNPDEQNLANQEQLREIEAAFYQRSKVRKYIARGKYLEAIAYYQKQVLQPLVELLRIKYRPAEPGFWLIHITDQLPADIVEKVSDIFKTACLEELEAKLAKAEKLYFETIKDLKS